MGVIQFSKSYKASKLITISIENFEDEDQNMNLEYLATLKETLVG